jgi:hypothetical protein
MTRYLCCVALLGVAAIPDWASACWPGGGSPFFSRPAYPMYTQPAYPMYAQPPIYVYPPTYPAAPSYPTAPPRIEIIPQAAIPTPAPAPPSGVGNSDSGATRPPVAPRLPMGEAVRPAGGIAPISPMTPVTPTPKKNETSGIPDYPTVEIPKSLGPLPKLDVPKEPDFRPIQAPKGTATDPPKKPAAIPDAMPPLPNLELPKDSGLKLPPLELPKDTGQRPSAIPGPGGAAVPSSAPAFPEPLIPPPSVPLMPDTKKTDSLPSLTLPPDTPVAPMKNDSTSRSSPLTGATTGKREMTVSVFPASSTERIGGVYRAVSFYNHTERDLNLTIEGRAVKLPAKTYLNAKLGATFTWSQGDRAAVRETVPEGASGLDVVFRE